MYASPKFMHYFPNYESKELEFRKLLLGLIPRRHQGPRCFWQDIQISRTIELATKQEFPLAYITSNPKDCLSFGTPSQVIRAAILTEKKFNGEPHVSYDEIVKIFNLGNIVYQPIRSLSGGEAVILALAKNYILANCSERLTISSPFSWLSSENMKLLNILLKQYENRGKEVAILAMEGEDSSKQTIAEIDNMLKDEKHTFKINFNNVMTKLRLSLELGESLFRKVYFNNFTKTLASPCFLYGENGSGKSLASYILSRAIAYNGDAQIVNEGIIGHARLVFQDIIVQTLFRNSNDIAESNAKIDSKLSYDVYAEIFKEFSNFFKSLQKEVPLIGYDTEEYPASLLQIKGMLVAARIATKPNALIVDEPDWGLSRDVAVALVVSIAKISHKHQIPVIIISHKPWWSGLAKSTVTITKEIIENDDFFIQMK